MNRRHFIKFSFTSATLTFFSAAALLIPKVLMAAWPKEAFSAATINNALLGLTGNTEHTASDNITMHLPRRNENGEEVSITIETTIKSVKSVNILVKENPTPLAASFQPNEDFEGYISTRIKVTRSSEVIVVIESDGSLYSQSKHIKIITSNTIAENKK
jgi:sulfur-oxidizing protein SoxY